MMHKFSVTTKSGYQFTNRELVTQKFVDDIYDLIANGQNAVIQVATRKNTGIMISIKDIEFVKFVVV